MRVLAIDPGPKESAFLVMENGAPAEFGKTENEKLLVYLQRDLFEVGVGTVVIEMIASYGMAVGAEVFETCVWIGRFIESWGAHYRLVKRKEIVLHFCNSPRAKDSNVRAAMLDRFGKPGTKNNPGVTYGIANDVWSALAIAAYYTDRMEEIEDGKIS